MTAVRSSSARGKLLRATRQRNSLTEEYDIMCKRKAAILVDIAFPAQLTCLQELGCRA